LCCFPYFTSHLGPHAEVVDENELRGTKMRWPSMTGYSNQFAIISVTLMRVAERGDRETTVFPVHLPLSVSLPHTGRCFLNYLITLFPLQRLYSVHNEKMVRIRKEAVVHYFKILS
jgi:uncharacterized membrane protein